MVKSKDSKVSQPTRIQPIRNKKNQPIGSVAQPVEESEADKEKRIFKCRLERIRERLLKKIKTAENNIKSNKSKLENYKKEMFWNRGDPRIKKVAPSTTTNSTETSTTASTTAENRITAASASCASIVAITATESKITSAELEIDLESDDEIQILTRQNMKLENELEHLQIKQEESKKETNEAWKEINDFDMGRTKYTYNGYKMTRYHGDIMVWYENGFAASIRFT